MCRDQHPLEDARKYGGACADADKASLLFGQQPRVERSGCDLKVTSLQYLIAIEITAITATK